MTVPYTFANQTGFIPLSELDANFSAIPNYANVAGNVTGNVQANITSLGILDSVSIAGNAVAGNMLSAGKISAAGNISGSYIFGNGSLLTSVTVSTVPASVLTGSALSANVLTSSLTAVGILSSLSVNGNITTGNISASRFTGSLVGNVAGTATYATTANSVAATNVSGTVATATYATSAGTATTATTSTSATTATTAGTVTINAQPNITSVGTLTGLLTTGNIQTGGYFIGNGSQLTGIATAYGNANVAAYLPTYGGNILASNVSATTVSTTGNITALYFVGNGSQLTGITTSYGNANVAAYLATYTGNITANAIVATGYITAGGNVRGLNLVTTGLVVGDGSQLTNISSNSVSYTAPYTGGTTITGNSKWSQFVSVLDFGADPTGGSDSRNAFQAALNSNKHVYIPAGNYKINSGLQINVPGQMISGDGRDASMLQIGSGFNLSSTAVFDCSNLQPGAILRDFGMTFAQPDTSSRASLTAYPVAIKATDSPRVTFQNLKIQGAINGINLTGNSGGAIIDLLEMSAFGTGISIDGSMDTIRIDKFHFWPFNLSANQQTIFYANPTRALSVGRCDGLFITEFLNISNLGLYQFQGGSGSAQIFIENSAFDSYNGILQTAGQLHVTNSYITIYPTSGLNGYIMNGTAVAQFTNCWFLGGATNQPMFLVQNAGTGSSLKIGECQFEGPVANQPFIALANSATTGAALQVSDCTFNIGSTNAYVINSGTPTSGTTNFHFVNNIVLTTANTAYTTPMFGFSTNNRIYMSGNRVLDKGSGAGVFISVLQDNYNWVSGNMAPGWTITTPAAVTGYYSNNPH